MSKDTPKLAGGQAPQSYQLLPPLSASEYEALKADIRVHGVRIPVAVDESGAILDGHHRARAACELGLVYATDTAPCRTDAEKRAYVLGQNLHRRHLSPEQWADVRRQQRDLAKVLASPPHDMTQEAIGRLLGVTQQCIGQWLDESNTTICNASVPDQRIIVPRAARPEIAARLAAGETQDKVASDYHVTPRRIGQIGAMVKARARRPASAETPAPPSGRYACIVIDPPWPVAKIEREQRPKQGVALDYPTLSIADIARLANPGELADPTGCHVFLWTMQSFLPEAFRLLEGWGARYLLTMVWHKPGGFQPYRMPQYNCEFIVVGIVGSPSFVSTKAFPCCFSAPRRGHSIKPTEFYELLRRVTPGPRLDMFARGGHEGFTSWGASAPSGETDAE